MNDLFYGTEHQKPQRKKPRTMAHMDDIGADMVVYECRKCGWKSGWMPHNNASISEIKRGIPCEDCN